jgi:amidase
MPIGPEYPSPEALIAIGKDHGITLSQEEAVLYRRLMGNAVNSLRALDAMVEPKLPVKYPRDAGYKPAPSDNPLNAWLWRCEIKGSGQGVLAGEDIGLKDVVCVAGLPLTNGSRVLEGFIPDVDATIVTRILDAGGTIVGKTNTEDFSFSGSGHTCSHGPVSNPVKPDHNPGASSSGSAAAIGSGDVAMAIGGDQGGSIRIPASWSGVYGLKPTYGLVPYTGCGMIEMTVDHIGPMASSTRGIAKLLTAIAGTDPLDPRQRGVIPKDFMFDYLEALGRGVKGMKIGIVSEGFCIDGTETGVPSSEAAVDEKVRAAAARFRDLGAIIEDVSIPWHLDGYHVYTAIMMEGATEFMLKGAGTGSNWLGYYNTNLQEALARGMATRAQDMPVQAISVLLTGEYMRRAYFGRYYAKGQNIRRTLTAAYDAALETYDILLMPTTPIRATKQVGRDASIEDSIAASFSMLRNTCVADVTGHPSMSVPCGMVDGLPVGMMLTGRHLEDATLIAASQAFEELGDWKTF